MPSEHRTVAQRLAAGHRLLVVVLLGFASGLPLALTGQAMQAWLSMEGLDVATIGFLSLVGLPYTFKFLWAPLMDRFDLPGLGRRRGWIVLTQLALALLLWALAGSSPVSDGHRASLANEHPPNKAAKPRTAARNRNPTMVTAA